MFCGGGAFGEDPRIALLKHVTATGTPARAHSQSTDQRPSNLRTTSSESLQLYPPPPEEAAVSLDDVWALGPLSCDVQRVVDEDVVQEESDLALMAGLRSSFVGQKSAGGSGQGSTGEGRSTAASSLFTRRAFVAQGAYRIGWMLDSERRRCSACAEIFGSFRRRHHCRGCGDIFCAACTSFSSAVPYLHGTSHRTCQRCFVRHRPGASPTRNQQEAHAILHGSSQDGTPPPWTPGLDNEDGRLSATHSPGALHTSLHGNASGGSGS